MTDYNEIEIGDYLSEQDYDLKKVNLVSRILDKDIRLHYKRGVNVAMIVEDSNKNRYFLISKAMPKVKSIDGNTAINHELAHILFNSFDVKANNTVKQWADQWGDFSGKAEKIYHEAMNVLEDQRIESLWGKIYLGNVRDFIKCRKNLGKDLEFANNPSAVMLAERFFRNDLVAPSKYAFLAQFVHDVENKEIDATMIVMNRIKPYLDEIINKLKQRHGETSEVNRKAHGVLLRMRDERAKPNNHDVVSKLETELNELKEKQEELTKDMADVSNAVNSPVTSRMNDEIRNESVRQNSKDNTEVYSPTELDDYDTLMKQSEQKANEKVKSIKIMMESGNEMPTNPVQVMTRNIDKRFPPSQMNINGGVVKQLQRLLKSFKERTRESIIEDGYDLDVGEYINLKAQGYGDCFVDETSTTGLSIVISIDGSGSMQQYNRTVKQMVSTLWKATEGYKNIQIKCITWTSDTTGNMYIKNYENMNDLKYLDKQVGGYTPTHFGIEMGSKLLKQMSGERKLLIIITDGYPNYKKSGVHVRHDVTVKECVKSYKRSLKDTPNILMVGFGAGLYNDSTMLNIFGRKRYIMCKTFNDVNTFMVNTLRKEIIRVMKH